MFNLLNLNDDEINENLKQGNILLHNNKKLLKKNKNNLKLITETSSPHLGYFSNIEGVENFDQNNNKNNNKNNDQNNNQNNDQISNTFLNGEVNSKLKLDSNYLQYIIWLLISFFLVLLTFHTFNTTDQSIFIQIILGSIIIFILYQLVSYIRNKYF